MPFSVAKFPWVFWIFWEFFNYSFKYFSRFKLIKVEITTEAFVGDFEAANLNDGWNNFLIMYLWFSPLGIVYTIYLYMLTTSTWEWYTPIIHTRNLMIWLVCYFSRTTHFDCSKISFRVCVRTKLLLFGKEFELST